MDTTISIDLGQVARDQGLTLDRVQRTVELLDEGNTVPFITRYRKDQTGGLDEEQIRRILEEVAKLRQLAERKQTILKSIESQGKLTAELVGQIKSARSPKHLEDLYLPFKPKKQTLATLARQRGLEPLALEILNADPAAADLMARAQSLVNPERKLNTVDEVLAGVRHILAEQFSERSDLRSRLRRILQRSGKLVSTRIEPSERRATSAVAEESHEDAAEEALEAGDLPLETMPDSLVEASAQMSAEGTSVESLADPLGDHLEDEHADATEDDDALHEELLREAEEEAADDDDGHGDSSPESLESPASESPASESPASDSSSEAASSPTELAETELAETEVAVPEVGLMTPTTAAVTRAGLKATAIPLLKLTARQQARAAAREAKKKKKQKLIESLYKDYYKYQEPLPKVPPHRVLAINRGERSQVLRVRLDADVAAMEREAEELLAPNEHPHGAFLKTCVHDALGRLVVPSLEREIRRELTEKAERHAVDVFVRNLRKLLLQPPVHGRRVLAVDPGFRSGCKLAALDEFGNLIDHGTIHIIGPEQHRQLCRTRLVDVIRKHGLSVIAIGNGTACRETEQLVADVLGAELRDAEVEYVIVNEAGASVYSTSPIGREELPKYDATVRGAVSIGRRLLDPLSELVKINPANIGVGLYQHDLKAKHLRESLDAVVESCVNYVGVDVNTASPALLRYVSGLNQLTARRLYEYRLQHGPFQSREQFKQVPGFGDATFVQSAGFLKIFGGGSPLDATWIHPESYEVARRVLERMESSEADLAVEVTPAQTNIAASASQGPAPFAADVLALGTLESTAPAEEAPAEEAPTSEAPTVEAPTVEAPTAEATTVEAPPVAASTVDVPVVEASTLDVAAAPIADAPTIPAVEEPAVEEPAVEEVIEDRVPLAERVARIDPEPLAAELGVGTLLLRDMLASLARPTRDPREDLPPPVFRRGIMRLEDLAPSMELSGTVLNVVDFGVFVDIGLSDSALVHISRLADRFIKDPHEVVGIGDVLKVWVVEVDKQRRRVSLTAIQPGSERPREARPPKPEYRGREAGPVGGERRGGGQARPAQSRPAQGGGRPPQGARPQGGRPQGGRPQGGRPQGGRPARPPQQVVKPKKSAPAPPITKEMIEGSQPMRTFGDLLQFYKKKKEDGEE